MKLTSAAFRKDFWENVCGTSVFLAYLGWVVYEVVSHATEWRAGIHSWADSVANNPIGQVVIYALVALGAVLITTSLVASVLPAKIGEVLIETVLRAIRLAPQDWEYKEGTWRPKK